jgi:carbon-monoxide dehydrogenase medium subunit
MGSTPLRASGVEGALRGEALSPDSIAAAAAHAADGIDPPAELNASAEYKAHLARVLCERALREAAGIA